MCDNVIGRVEKKVPFLAKARHWCLHLHLNHSKFDLSNWVTPSVPMIMLKYALFNFEGPIKNK